ncbi:MAG TPA: ABC transporter permease subunit [Microvirga sp.]|jgi:thiamine transport system permease protein|nr:ABC transporter permease subunit [Microvirga sp.]
MNGRLRGQLAGALVLAGILALVAGSLGALASAAGASDGLSGIGPYLVRILAFSTAQAALSTLLSLALGVPLALALARRRFPGRHLALAALGAAAVMPAIVVVFAVVAVYGRGGWLSGLLAQFGIGPAFRVYGWPGILIGHVLLNAPLVARVALDALARVPAEHWRLARLLGFSPLAVLRHLDLPVLRAELAGLASLVFLLCFTSFAIVLTLGGGGRASLEVAIFEALRVDLDFARAAALSVVQIVLCGTVALALHRAVARAPVGHTLRAAIPRPDRDHRGLRLLDGAVLALGALLILPPLLSLAAALPHLSALLDADVARALVTSLAIALASAGLATGMALALAGAARSARLVQRSGRAAALYDLAPALVIAAPPFALTAGLFLLVRRAVDPALAGYALLPLMNALGALPFAYRFLAGPAMAGGERYGRLADLLRLRGLARLRIVDWPLLRRPFAAAFAMAMALSFGDFGVVALLGGSELRTLPYLLYERLGAYRLDEAAALGLLLVLVAFALAYASSRFTDVSH